ncbi:hypothetical protein M514_04087, partial [Trichuris suis]
WCCQLAKSTTRRVQVCRKRNCQKKWIKAMPTNSLMTRIWQPVFVALNCSTFVGCRQIRACAAAAVVITFSKKPLYLTFGCPPINESF